MPPHWCWNATRTASRSGMCARWRRICVWKPWMTSSSSGSTCCAANSNKGCPGRRRQGQNENAKLGVMTTLSPAYTYPDQVTTQLRQQGYAVLSPQGVSALSGCALDDLQTLRASWNDLPPDDYLKDGGRYRKRRHSCFVLEGDRVVQAPHRAHWQPVEYNALHGGMQRWFAPMDERVV